MNSDIFDILSMGALIVFVFAVVLLLMVQRELGNNGKLNNKGRWLLTASLGSGVLAFSFKLGLIVIMVNMPGHVIGAYTQTLTPRVSQSSSVITAVQPPAKPQQYIWQALPETPPIPANNPQSAEKIALGKRLFFDKNLSLTRDVSCASCHDVDAGAGIDGQAVSTGIYQQQGTRNAPTVWNTAFQSVLFWDGRAASLEEQAKGPLVNPLEMGMPSYALVEQRVSEDADYRIAFADVFGVNQAINIDRIAEAIAAYERTLITPDTPYDRFVRGDTQALNKSQLRGMALFESVGCVLCHSGANFSAASIDSNNSPYRLFPSRLTAEVKQYALNQDTGLAKSDEKHGVWRIPSLRNVALTAPYFHNGTVNELEEAVRIMASVQLGKPTGKNGELGESRSIWSHTEQTLTHVESQPLSEQQIADIVAFLQALSSERLVALQKANK